MTAAVLLVVVWLAWRDLRRHELARRPSWSYCGRHGPQGFACLRHRWHRGEHSCLGLWWSDGWKGWTGSNTEPRGNGRRWTNYTDPEAMPGYHSSGEQDTGGRRADL